MNTDSDDDVPIQRVVCGKTYVDWENAIVYVHNKLHPKHLPTHMHFVFLGKGKVLTHEAIRLQSQWTHYGKTCLHIYHPGCHEYNRARKMACKIVETYRKNYMTKHGNPPNALGLPTASNTIIHRKKTEETNRKISEALTGQKELVF